MQLKRPSQSNFRSCGDSDRGSNFGTRDEHEKGRIFCKGDLSRNRRYHKYANFFQAIVLVGGLGASEYVYKRLNSRFVGTEVMQPLNA